MNPLDIIKNGIIDGDWQQVCNGFEKITGEWIAPPCSDSNEVELTPPEMISKIQNIVKYFDNTINLPQKTKKKITQKKTKKTTKKNDTERIMDETPSVTQVTESVVGKTVFITNEIDPTEVRANTIRAEKTKDRKVKLNRPTHKQYKVKCNECDKEFDSSRSDGKMGQKCQQCLNAKKGRMS